MTVQEFFDGLTSGATWSAGVAFKRSNPLPIDRYSVFNAYTPEGSAPDADDGSLNYYIEKNPVAYPGQVVAVIAEGSATVYVLQGETGGTLTPVALASSETTADIAELEGKVAALETWKGQVETWQNTVLVDGDVETSLSGSSGKIPDSAAVKTVTDGLSSEIDALEGTVSGLGSTYEALANKTSDIETDKASTDKYTSAKGVVDYVAAQIDAIPDVDLTPYQTTANLSNSTAVDSDLASETKYPSVAAAKKLADDAADTVEASVDTKLAEYIKTTDADSKYIAQSKVETSVSGTAGNIPDSGAVKTYVDTAVGSVDVEKTLEEVLTAGATAANKNVTLTGPSSLSIGTLGGTPLIKLDSGLGTISIDGAVGGHPFSLSTSKVSGGVALKESFKTWLEVNNVTNESKATMFTNPTFTGTVTVPVTPANNTDAASKKYVDDSIAASTPTLAQVVAKGNVITGTEATDKTTLSAGVVSLENATNNFKVDVVSASVTGSEGMKDAFINWLGVGQVYRYETA